MLPVCGCAKGCSREHPYTPFHIDSTRVDTANETVGARNGEDAAGELAFGPTTDAGVGYPKRTATVPIPADADRWLLESLTFQAPPGARPVMGLIVRLASGGPPALLVWGASNVGAPDALWMYRNPSNLSAAPENWVTAPAPPAGCTYVPSLTQIGEHSAAVGLQLNCPADSTPPTSPTASAWWGIVSWVADPPLRQRLTLAPLRAGELLDVGLDGLDRDGDGVDDLTVSLTLSGNPPPFDPSERAGQAHAELVWLDRPAGMSRDAREPLASLSMVGPESARNLARLAAILCADIAGPALSASSGVIHCGSTRPLEDASTAEFRHALAAGNLIRANAEFERLERLDSSGGAARARRREMERAFLRAAKGGTTQHARVIAVVPEPSTDGTAAWGALMFIPTGELLVRKREGVARVDVSNFQEISSGGIAAWPLEANSPDGKARLLEVFDPCDGFSLRARVASEGDPANSSREIAIPVPTYGPPLCAGTPTSRRIEVLPVGWQGGGLSILVDGRLVQFTPKIDASAILTGAASADGIHAGSPRSPDGQYLAVASRFGVIVRSPSGIDQLRPVPAIGSGAPLRGCTASNGGGVVACLQGPNVVVISPR